jgi:hypothetical protein
MHNKAILFVLAILLAASMELDAQSWQPSGSNIFFTGGNVGIRTSTPSTSLEVIGEYVFQQKIASSGAYAGLLLNSGLSTKQLGIHYGSYGTTSETTNTLRFGRYDKSTADQFGNGWQANVVLLDMDAPDGSIVLDENGNIGFGTYSTNGYKMAVAGSALFTKVTVKALPWADYVFHANYRLRPLSEVEQYIKQHHHLPEVPSAAEVEKNGLDVGDNQATLLKKIEELTLYVIEQNKKIEELQSEVRALKKKEK